MRWEMQKHTINDALQQESMDWQISAASHKTEINLLCLQIEDK